MSQVMDKLNIGDKLFFKGPRGDFSLDLNEKREIGLDLYTLQFEILIYHPTFGVQAL